MRFLTSILLIMAAMASGRSAEPTPGVQVEMLLELPDGAGSIPYLLYLPEEYESKPGPWPLLFFLHGRGESHGPLSLVKAWGPPRRIEHGDHFAYVVASPQCPSKESWSQPRQQTLLLALLDHLAHTYRTDAGRVYLTGLSMGGYGSWRLAADHPQRFSAVAPICGGGKPEDAAQLKGLPIWVWHGTEDGAVPFQRSLEMVEAIKAAGGERIRFTSLEGIGHNSWEAAYATPELYQWMDKQPSTGLRAPDRAVGQIPDAHTQFVNVDGAQIHYVSCGEGPRTLLFVHGWSCHTGFWNEQASLLRDKARLIFVDLPGHGQSDMPDRKYTMDYFARAVLAVMKNAGAEKAALIGHSMGVPVICRAYAQAPDKVTALVAVDGTLRRPEIDPQRVERFISAYRAPDYRDSAAAFLGRMFPDPESDALRKNVLADMLLTPQHVMAGAFEGMFDLTQPAWDLAETQIPVLAIHAPNPMWSADYEAFVRSRSPQSDYRVIEDVGHFLMLEQPEKFNTVLLEMLKQHRLIMDQ